MKKLKIGGRTHPQDEDWQIIYEIQRVANVLLMCC